MAATAMVGSVQAVPTIDGTADGEYGAALSVQNTLTRFGDSPLGDLIASTPGVGGSEIDQVFGIVSGDRLYVTIAGNLENNFNKLDVFIDSVADGVNVIDGDVFSPDDNNVPFGLDPFSYGPERGLAPPKGPNTDNGGALQSMDGLTFDTGFGADYALVFTHGGENVGAVDPISFWSLSAHYADLTQDTNGAVVAAGMQLAPKGMPNVLRFPFDADFDNNSVVNGADRDVWQANYGTTIGAIRETGDADGDGDTDGDDFLRWQLDVGVTRSLADLPFQPSDTTPPTTALIGPVLPGLGQGQLIDRDYAQSVNGGCVGDTGAGCVAAELEFVLDVNPTEINVGDPSQSNASNHREFHNTIGLQMALDNSNTEGVSGAADNGDPMDLLPGDDPQNVITGIEFSIPLAEIGNPTGDIKITAFVNNGDHNYVSNQFAGDGISQGNLGGDGSGGFTGDLSGIDLSTIAGDQFVTVVQSPPASNAVPEPGSLVLVLTGILTCGVLTRREK